jgi:hypothetical protein
MINLEKILKQDRQIRATTGLNRKAFEALLPSFEEAYQQMLDKKRRWRAAGGGRKATLKTSADKLFFILLYCKCYPTFDLMSVIFGFDRSCANDWVHRLLPILETALGKKQALPERKIHSIEEFLAKFADVQEVIIDGTERPVQRPKDAEQQKEHYSGKKKRHTRKHVTGSTRKKWIILLSKARAGKVHDKKQLHEEDWVSNIPDQVVIEGDLGYQGLQNEFVNIRLPHKKPRGQELTEEQKQENREFSSLRVKCEHAHGGMKRYNSVTAVYRNRVTDFDDRLMLNAAGLWNFYLDAS